jgi:hypothetical protein
VKSDGGTPLVNAANDRWPAAGLPCPDDYGISVVVTIDTLSLSLKMNGQYDARTGTNYCCVGPNRGEMERETKKKKWVQPNIMWRARRRDNVDRFGGPEERRSEDF